MAGLGWTPVKGAPALYQRRAVVIVEPPGALLTAVRFEDRTVLRVDTQELEPAPGTLDDTDTKRDTHNTADELWVEAQRRLEILRPLLNLPPPGLSRAMVVRRAQESRRWPKRDERLDAATLYRWLGRYRASGEVLSLVRRQRKDLGGRHLPAAVVDAVNAALAPYLKNQLELGARKARRQARKLLFQSLLVDIEIICREQQVAPPSESTVRSMLRALSPLERAQASGSRRDAARHTPLTGTFDPSDHPYDTVQIDHTPLNVAAVDEHGDEIGQPWLTLAIDVRTRMVVGLYLSLFPPSAYSVLRCLAQAMLPKTPYLKALGLAHSWPCYGKIRVVHSDNGPDFRSGELRRALLQRDVHHHFRELTQPHWGAHIESLMKTTAEEMRPLPGYKGRDVAERKDLDLDPKATASMTLAAIQTWLLNWVCNTYHRRKHSTLGDSPYNVFLKLINTQTGTLDLITGARAEKLNIDLLPTFEAAITPKGVVHDYLHYYEPFLAPFVGELEHPLSRRTRKHRFHYDWHDLSAIYWFDDRAGTYQKVRWADLRRPPISYWERKQASARLRAEQGEIDEEAIFQSVLEGRRIVEESNTRTRTQRRQAAKNKESVSRRGPKVVAEGTVARELKADAGRTRKPAPQPTVHDDLPDYPVTVRVRA